MWNLACARRRNKGNREGPWEEAQLWWAGAGEPHLLVGSSCGWVWGVIVELVPVVIWSPTVLVSQGCCPLCPPLPCLVSMLPTSSCSPRSDRGVHFPVVPCLDVSLSVNLGSLSRPPQGQNGRCQNAFWGVGWGSVSGERRSKRLQDQGSRGHSFFVSFDSCPRQPRDLWNSSPN